MQTITREITEEVMLCDEAGRLNPEAAGWSRHPLHVCNLQGRTLRKKKWHYWCITGADFLFSATIAHIDYLSLGGAYCLAYDSRRFARQGGVKLFSMKPEMPERVAESVRFDSRRMNLAFEHGKNGLNIMVEAKHFGGKPLEASVEIAYPPGHETLNVVVPWNETTFQFTSKQHCLPARGKISWGGEEFIFKPGTAYACLDYGRGIWPYRTVWNWASFSGHSGEDVVGLNMGAKWTDGTGMNENGILLNGRLYKIFEDILFEYDPGDFMRPWRMRTESSDAVRLEFTPFYERADHVNLLLIRSRAHQCFGHYSGTLQADGRSIPIDGILGWAEEHRARW